MSKDRINNKLDKMFSSLQSNQESALPAVPDGLTQGYAWETDASGIYTSCEGGIKVALGYDPSELIGNPFLSFQLPLEDQKKLREALNDARFPVELEMDTFSKNGTVCKIRWSIFEKFDEAHARIGFRGYCEKLLEPEKPLKPRVKSGVKPKKQPVHTSPIKESQSDTLKKTRHTKELPPLNVHTSPLPGADSAAEDEKKEKPARRRKTGFTKDLSPDQSTTISLTASSASPLDQSEALVKRVPPTEFKDLSGLSLVKHQFDPSTSVWTAQAQSSFDDDKLVAIPSVKGSPAILAVPLNLRNEKSGVIEIIDDKPNRVWTEEEQLLLKEVAAQLGQALENTQLYSTIQRELSERVKAERESLRRNKDLSNLNQIGQQLSQLVSRKEIFEITSAMTQKIMGVENLLLTLLDRNKEQFIFPVCLVNGIPLNLQPRPLGKGYQETILDTKKPLLINKNVASTLAEKSIDHSTYIPYSLLAVPLYTGDRAIGVLSVFNYQNEDAFDQIQLELLSSVAAQVATALENTNLFNEINEALQLIEKRQKIQAHVTNAVAELSLKGSTSLSFLLQSLAQATQCERAFYAQGMESADGQYYWQTAATYTSADTFSSKQNAHLMFEDHPHWVSGLGSTGWMVMNRESAPEPERTWLTDRGIKSMLLLAVKVENQPFGFIALENDTSLDAWKSDDIDMLRTASEAFANTLIRENLLERLRTSLSETENLYSASHQLALAGSMQEMILAVISSDAASAIDRGEIVLFDYNFEGSISRMTVASCYSTEGTQLSRIGEEYLAALYEPLLAEKSPNFIDNLEEANISQLLKSELARGNVRSMAVLPLWSGSVQIGALLLQSTELHHFSAQETRSYPPLVDQMATAIQNLRLFESTQSALAETELLYQISSGIAKSSGMEELVNLVGLNVLPQNADALFLFVVSGETQTNSPEYELAGCFSATGEILVESQKIPAGAFSLLRFPSSEPLILADTSKRDQGTSSQYIFKHLGIASAVIIPLQTASNPVGFLLAGSHEPREINPKDAHTLQIIGNSIAVAIERQRLLFEAQRRALELQTAAEIARDTTSTLSQDILLSRIVNLLKDRFGYYHCSIFLLDTSNQHAVVEESTGDAGKLMKQNKHKLAVGSKSVIGTCIASGQPVIVNDTNLSPVYYPNPLLLETRSEMGIPLKIGGRVIGALDLHSTSTNAFSENEITVLQILSDQISVAIENARAYSLSQQAVQEMKELDRVKSQFLANMSHELRTPLNSVIGFSRVILKGIDGPINKVQEQDITSIYNSGMNLLNMINEILDISKIEAGKMELQLDDIQIADVIGKAVATATGLIKDKPLELVQKVPADLPTIKADELKIGQVVLNLLSNAIKFTEKGSITIEATLGKDENLNPEIKVTVADAGIGIAAADQAKLFQRFSQVDDSPTRKTGGTGLGLSISRSLIELHGGKIGLQSSEPGKGSVFFFTLPAAKHLKGLDIHQLGHGENVILSIDDDPQVIALYERYLKNYGFEVVPLLNPAKAVEKAVELKPFAITLDIMMPQVDGWQVLHELKQDERTRDIPILVCSIVEEEEKGFSLGAAEYLVKPFLQDDLINAIHRINREGRMLEVLVIDDDPDDLKFVKKMVETEASFHPTLAQGGSAALEILNNLTPDLIILDLFMPDMNGFELLERFKSEPRLARIPVIVLTGADLSAEQKTLLAESTKSLSTHTMLKESDILKNMEEALQKIKPLK